nr:right-handed parallel beta-helix repeat-containing protein [Planctomycetota bacterium]
MIRIYALLALLVAMPLGAATLTVTNLNDSGAGSLRDQCAAAASGDTIVFQTGLAGTITLNSGIDLGSKSLTLTGNATGLGAPAITLSGSGSWRILRQTGGTLTLSLLNLQFGYASINGGGAILGNVVNCTTCTFTENLADNSGGGGAIGATGAVTCSGCTFTENETLAGNGGAINCPSDVVTCTNCTFSNQGPAGLVVRGGAIFTYNLTCSGCTFAGNGSADAGGAVQVSNAVTCTNCTFSGNSAAGTGGGAIHTDKVTCTNCTFSGNSAAVGGGAMFCDAGSLTNCTFSGNSATSEGGAIGKADGNPLTCTNCTFAGNSAGSEGGAIVAGASFTLAGCTFSANSAPVGGCVSANVTAAIATVLATNCAFADTGMGSMFANTALATFASGGYNICTRALADVPWLNATGDQVNTNPMLGPLQNNGGPVFTMRPLIGSPAIDKGGSSGATDARGIARPFDNPAIANASGGDGRDIGAVEFVFNSAPVITAPAALNIARDTAYVFSGTVSITDDAAVGDLLQLTLTATQGSVTLAQLTGLTFSVGDGTSDAAMTFTGTLANINAALSGMTFTPTPAYLGAAALQIGVNDQGHTGDDATVLTDSETVAITVVELPEITLLRDGVEVVDGGGDNAYGAAGTAIARTFTIRNDGLSTLNIGAITFSNQNNC